MKNILPIIISCAFLFTQGVFAQNEDYFGAGNTNGITVTSSSDFESSTALKSLDGSGLHAKIMEASRLLGQATMGANYDDIDFVLEIGQEGWINWQMELPRSEYLPLMQDTWDEILAAYLAVGYTEDDVYGPWALHFNYAWWTNVATQKDQLRQRVAFALSELLVISMNSDIIDYGEGISYYYDILSKHAFGNYKDLLTDVSLNPLMGYFLSHLNNPREDLEENIHPDENFARELMQLFTIGLYELNNDGTRKTDGNGNVIPTYDNDDIKQLARVFTGLGPGGILDYVDWTDEPYFGLDLYGGDRTVPMIMYPEYHEHGTKELINGFVIPANQESMKDIDDAITHLFNHPNVGPFVSKHLIQRLVTSNPSPAYIDRIASIFNSDENGDRGNLGSVVKAILLDQDARSCAAIQNPRNGKMREPILRYSQFIRSIPMDNPLDRYWNNSFNFWEDTEQTVLYAPTVFNFFPPDHQPVGDLTANNLVAPEFSLHNTRTSINYINQVNQWIIWAYPWWSWEGDIDDPEVRVDFDSFPEELKDPEALITWFDILYTNGQMTDQTRNNLRARLSQIYWEWEDEDWMYRIMLAGYLTMISPDFVIQK